MALTAWPLAAQQVRELGVQATATASDPALGAVGGYIALRPSQRSRISLVAAAGVSGGQLAWRGELLAHFLLNPLVREGAGVYAAGGLAVVGGPVERGYLVLTLGVDSGPGASEGWFAEAGVGGGFRVSGGYRWRQNAPAHGDAPGR
ncbi:MAG: hypothetical protein ACR2HK_10410 [Gemmatimonadales bacterium]